MLEAARRRSWFVSMRRYVVALALMLCALSATVRAQAPDSADMPAHVRVVNTTPIVRWYPRLPSDVLTTVEPGMTLEVIGQEQEWYWVVTPRDAHGSRRGGWIAAGDVEAFEEEPVRISPVVRLQPAPAAPPSAPPIEEPAPPHEVAPEEPSPAGTTAESKPFDFADILFDRDRATIKPESATVLNDAAMALADDLLLRLTIEGHTCSLGSSAYNMALGARRATAVRDYLVSRGVTADRLSTISFGEERPAHDNSREDTRRLNRRVVLVPETSGPTSTSTSTSASR